jgi:hypothetical protein
MKDVQAKREAWNVQHNDERRKWKTVRRQAGRSSYRTEKKELKVCRDKNKKKHDKSMCDKIMKFQ